MTLQAVGEEDIHKALVKTQYLDALEVRISYLLSTLSPNV
jgi:hypothetical protein